MQLSTGDIEAITLTLRLALLTTLLLLLIGTPLAWWLCRSRNRLRHLVAAVVTLPLVLPPTVLGFYLLLLLGNNSPLGISNLAFTFEGLVVASVIYSLPFIVQPIRDAFASLGDSLLESAATLRASPLNTFFTVALPLSRHGVMSGAVLTFAHTVGEFGVVLMIGGNMPGETRVVSVAIFDYVESMQYQSAHLLAAVLLIFSFMVLWGLHQLNQRVRSGTL